MTSIPFPSVDEQMEILMRGVNFGDALTYQHMAQALRARLTESYNAGKPLRVYCGFDPSAPDLHLGHTVPMRKLRQFQDLGHEVVFLIGSFTGTIGDPSDKESVRSQQTLQRALAAAQTYTEQAWRVLEANKTQVRYNHEWLGELSFTEVIELASHFTVQQFLTRDNFSQRFAKGDAIWLHEFFYALMQAQDAVVLETDVQVGGTDQLFNLMAGRKLMEAKGMKPQVILTFDILVGVDGLKRMSKSTGNYIGINEAPGIIYTKVINVPDTAMRNYAELVTRWSQEEINHRLAQVESGILPMRDFKQQLAWEIVSIFHGDAAANQAAADARKMYAGDAPSDAPVFHLQGTIGLVELLQEAGLVQSKSEGRRLIQQSGVRLNGAVVTDVEVTIQPTRDQEQILRAGKRNYLRIVA
ncbi:MAG: tyrosine--tRNA ligase [Caldilineaceae bacterium]|nr:tyrosine--tRNA ligase [Caldilineaceae bacterium]